MSDVETHRSISINVAKERLQIRTDLSDADLKEIVDYIDERYASYGKYNLEAGKRMALLALEMAQQFEDLGMRRLHVVDLDGAKSKHVVNLSALRAITAHTGLVVDFGGGVKTDEDLEKAYEAGASLVTVGSIAITNGSAEIKRIIQMV